MDVILTNSANESGSLTAKSDLIVDKNSSLTGTLTVGKETILKNTLTVNENIQVMQI